MTTTTERHGIRGPDGRFRPVPEETSLALQALARMGQPIDAIALIGGRRPDDPLDGRVPQTADHHGSN